MDSYQQFFQGVRGSFNGSSNILSFLIFIVVLGVLIIIIRAFYKYYQSYLKARLVLNAQANSTTLQKHVQEFNPLQKKAVYDIIGEFKKKEMIAQTIPVTILEKYSEYFYHQVDRLKISNTLANRMAMQIFPITVNSNIEIQIFQDEKLYVFDRKVIVSNNNAVVVNSLEGHDVRIIKGMPVYLFYTASNQCISGVSSVVNNIPNDRMILSYPKNLKVSDVRRFIRIPLTNVEGKLATTITRSSMNPQEIKITLKDISLEGARIQANAVLKKNYIYKLSFQDTGIAGYNFQDIECAVSKSLLGDNIFEYGLSFIYLDIETREKLVGYLKDLANRMKFKK